MKNLSEVVSSIRIGIRDRLSFVRAICKGWLLRHQNDGLRPPHCSLPDPLLTLDGIRVSNPRTWVDIRRPELLELFRTHVYGHAPLWSEQTVHSVVSVDNHALGGIATRKEIQIRIGTKSNDFIMALLLYLPNKQLLNDIKVPAFLSLNLYGNHTIHKDPAISISNRWVPDNLITKGKPPENLRGIQSSRWPLEFILAHGYGLATACSDDIVPDRKDGLEITVQRLVRKNELVQGRGYSWGAIDGWAWGLSRAMDYLEQDMDLDSSKIAVIGHSRLGKAALWAGANDERFAIIISNESGRGGAALARRRVGETVAQINSSFPHWFCDNFKRYNNNEAALPVDQHELISLMAPRPVYVSSAQRDLHADPLGEFLAAKHANPVYRLLGTDGLPAEEMPVVNTPVMGTIGYHIRTGYHGIAFFDWAQYIIFADMHFLT